MKTQITKTQTVLITVTALALILSGAIFYSNRSLKNHLQKEKIRSETLLSEKLNLEKSIDAFKKDLALLKGKNAELDKVVKETSNKLSKKESEIRKLMAENASLSELKKKNEELETLRKKLEEEIANLNLNMDKLMAENKQFSEQVASIKTENETLAAHNALLEAMLADNYRIEALKGKHDKLTVAARRTNRLMVSFDMPSEVGNEIFFKIITPDGKELSSRNDNAAVIKFYDEYKNILASLTGAASGDQKARRAELIYKPDHKLIKGIYRFNIYDGKDYMGSIQLRLK
jgi:DNA repair exonuclease SbcCD ATPase subunit